MPEDEKPTGEKTAEPYKRLAQRHPDHNEKRFDLVERLYEGGFAVTGKASELVTRLDGESNERYDIRCKTTSYAPYFGQILDGFISDLFNQSLSILPAGDAENPNTPGELPDEEYWPEFARDADCEGTPFVELIADGLTAALMHRRGIIAADSPPTEEAGNKLEEKQKGGDRLYVYVLPTCQIIDWKMCDRNKRRFEWCIRHEKKSERSSPGEARDTVMEVFTVWTLVGPDEKDAKGNSKQRARWDRYSITYPTDRPPTDETMVPWEAGKTTAFDRIPLIVRDLPKGLWLGNKIAGQQREHYNRRSALVGAMNMSLYAIPYVARGSEINAPGGVVVSESQEDPDRGSNMVAQFKKRGWLAIGAGDKLAFAEPEGRCYDLVDKTLDELRKDMFAVNFQMAASVRPTPGSMARSGKSKEKDGEATAKVLRKLAFEVKAWAADVYDCIAVARGEDVKWTAHGMDVFESDSREEVLEEAISIDAMNIPSPTFRKAHRKKVARQVLENADPATFAQIDQEIDDATDDEFEKAQESDDLEHEAEVENLKAKKENPAAAQPKLAPPGFGPQPPKVPQQPAAKPPSEPKPPLAKTVKEPGGKKPDGK